MSPAHDLENSHCHCDPDVFCACRACGGPNEPDPECRECAGAGSVPASAGDRPPFVIVHYDDPESDEPGPTSGKLEVYPW